MQSLISGELAAFFELHSESMPVVIDRQRIIRYCAPRLSWLLGYGWQADLINGARTIDEFVLPEFREQHAKLIDMWFERPLTMEMHARGPIPIITRSGGVEQALVKLVPYEWREPTMLSIFDQKPTFHACGVAFITLLPRSWRLAIPEPLPASHAYRTAGAHAEPTGDLEPAGAGRRALR